MLHDICCIVRGIVASLAYTYLALGLYILIMYMYHFFNLGTLILIRGIILRRHHNQ